MKTLAKPAPLGHSDFRSVGARRPWPRSGRPAGGVPPGLLPLCVAELACAAGNGAAGVSPKDKVTRGKVFLKSDRLNGGTSLQAMALRYHRAFDASGRANVEVTWVRIDISHMDSPRRAGLLVGLRRIW